jgi:MYXO-CTERM domain-containing protein
MGDGVGLYMFSGEAAGAVVRDTFAENQVVLDPSFGLLILSANNTRCESCTVLGAQGAAGFYVYTASNLPGDGVYSFFGVNLLTANNAQGGIHILPEIQTWQVESSNVFQSGTALRPETDARWVGPTSEDPELGNCRVYIPDASPMKGAGKDNADIGANVLYRYVDGVLTDEPLWDPETGAFPCGAVIAGVNDVAGSSCFDVHERLNVNRNGCAFPAWYAENWNGPGPGPGAGPGPGPGAGPGPGSGSNDSGGSGAAADDSVGGACACRVGGRPDGGSVWLWAAVGFAMLLRRRVKVKGLRPR